MRKTGWNYSDVYFVSTKTILETAGSTGRVWKSMWDSLLAQYKAYYCSSIFYDRQGNMCIRFYTESGRQKIAYYSN